MTLNPDRIGVVNFLNFVSDSAFNILGPIADPAFLKL